ncbi:MAG: hypothetical protein HGA95_01540 [Caldiserica bacterium]|nr:hypothetical protein [Caldisericota bacterium]
MNLQQSSKILEFCSRTGSSWENSRIKRVVDSILRFWDRAVSGSIIINWVTGGDVWSGKNYKPSYFGLKIQECWTSTIKWLNTRIHSNPQLENSKSVSSIKTIVHFFQNDFMAALGWIGCAFFPAYGILRLNIVGLSMTTLIVIIAGFLLSVVFVFTKVNLIEMIKSSRLLKVLDDIDK